MDTRRIEPSQEAGADPHATRVLPLEGEPPPPLDVSEPAGTLESQSEIRSPKSEIARNTAIVGAAFVLSRVLGLVREAVIAGQFGLTGDLDAYNAAFRIPDTLFLLIVGGAVGSAFIPVFTALLTKG
jgi:hypothetical protein